MDYVIGLIAGYFIKDIINFLKKINKYDWDNRNTYKKAYNWSDYDYYLTEDDLP